MATETPFPLLARRLVIVSGKGGTGKTTVAAALALAGTDLGLRVLVAEVGRHEQLPKLLDPTGAPIGHVGREIRPGLTCMQIDPFAALAEYLGLQIGSRALVERMLRTQGFRQLMEAAPGWRELITLGKIWHLEQMRLEGGEPTWELIVVDAPATGHGVTFLDVPRVVHSAIRTGPLRRHAGWVEDMIRDRERTLLLPVALAEDLPVRETLELVERVRSELDIAVECVVVNDLAPKPLPPDLEDLSGRLRKLPAGCDVGALPEPRVLADCLDILTARYQLNRRYVGEITRGSGLPVIELPHLAGGLRGPGDLTPLAAILSAEMRA